MKLWRDMRANQNPSQKPSGSDSGTWPEPSFGAVSGVSQNSAMLRGPSQLADGRLLPVPFTAQTDGAGRSRRCWNAVPLSRPRLLRDENEVPTQDVIGPEEPSGLAGEHALVA